METPWTHRSRTSLRAWVSSRKSVNVRLAQSGMCLGRSRAGVGGCGIAASSSDSLDLLVIRLHKHCTVLSREKRVGLRCAISGIRGRTERNRHFARDRSWYVPVPEGSGRSTALRSADPRLWLPEFYTPPRFPAPPALRQFRPAARLPIDTGYGTARRPSAGR